MGPRPFSPPNRLPPKTKTKFPSRAVGFVSFPVPAKPVFPLHPHRSRGPGKQLPLLRFQKGELSLDQSVFHHVIRRRPPLHRGWNRCPQRAHPHRTRRRRSPGTACALLLDLPACGRRSSRNPHHHPGRRSLGSRNPLPLRFVCIAKDGPDTNTPATLCRLFVHEGTIWAAQELLDRDVNGVPGLVATRRWVRRLEAARNPGSVS
jgi:hypothetical protein